MSTPTTNERGRGQSRGGQRGRSRDDDAPQGPDGATTAIVRDALGETQIAPTGEVAATVTAERAKAIVQARIMQAIARPRVFEIVRERLMADCDRPRFAMTARYARPQGWVTDENGRYVLDEHGQKIRNYITGWSIRFVEAAVQALGNASMGTVMLFEDDRKKIIRCEAWDYERNVDWPQEITIEKSIERKYLKEGQVPLTKRPNSYGDTVYILPATDDETRLKENRLVSMTLRTLGLRIVPGDLLDEALERVERARIKAIEAEREGVRADPKVALKRVLDNFASIGVRAADIVEYLGGRSIESATPDMILELRIVGADVKAGNYTWRDAVAGSPYREDAAATNGDGKENEAARAAREKIEAKLRETKEKKAASAGGAPQEPSGAGAATPDASPPAAGAPSSAPAPAEAAPATTAVQAPATAPPAVQDTPPAPAAPSGAPAPAAPAAPAQGTLPGTSAPTTKAKRMREPGED